MALFLVVDDFDGIIATTDQLTLGIFCISFNDGKDSNNSANPDDNPQHGQHRAHFVGQDGV